MDKDRSIGAGKQLAGSVAEALGKLVGDARLQDQGRAEQAEGTLQVDAGMANDVMAKDTLKK